MRQSSGAFPYRVEFLKAAADGMIPLGTRGFFGQRLNGAKGLGSDLALRLSHSWLTPSPVRASSQLRRRTCPSPGPYVAASKRKDSAVDNYAAYRTRGAGRA